MRRIWSSQASGPHSTRAWRIWPWEVQEATQKSGLCGTHIFSVRSIKLWPLVSSCGLSRTPKGLLFLVIQKQQWGDSSRLHVELADPNSISRRKVAVLPPSLQSLISLELGPSVNKMKSVVSSSLPLVGVETIGRALGYIQGWVSMAFRFYSLEDSQLGKHWNQPLFLSSVLSCCNVIPIPLLPQFFSPILGFLCSFSTP